MNTVLEKEEAFLRESREREQQKFLDGLCTLTYIQSGEEKRGQVKIGTFFVTAKLQPDGSYCLKSDPENEIKFPSFDFTASNFADFVVRFNELHKHFLNFDTPLLKIQVSSADCNDRIQQHIRYMIQLATRIRKNRK